MKKHAFSVGKIVLSVATVPLWFVKMFVGIGHLPDQTTGEIVSVTFRHSMHENVIDLTHPLLPYAAMAIALASAVMNAIVIRYPDHKGIGIAANVIFVISTASFLLLLLLASTVDRGY